MDLKVEYIQLLSVNVYEKVFGDMHLKGLDSYDTSVLVLASGKPTFEAWGRGNNELD